MRRVIHLVKKELLELRQDPRLFGIVIMAPIIQLTVLGYAATTDVKDVPLVVVDADRSSESRKLIARFQASDNFKLVGLLSSTEEIDRWLDRGDAWMALSIPPDYGQRVEARRPVVAPGGGRWHRRQFHQRGDGLRPCAGGRVRAGAAAGTGSGSAVSHWSCGCGSTPSSRAATS